MQTIQFETTSSQGQLQIPKSYPDWQNKPIKVILWNHENPPPTTPTWELLQQIRDFRQALGPMPNSTTLIRQGRDQGW